MHKYNYEYTLRQVLKYIQSHGSITAGQLKDLMQKDIPIRSKIGLALNKITPVNNAYQLDLTSIAEWGSGIDEDKVFYIKDFDYKNIKSINIYSPGNQTKIGGTKYPFNLFERECYFPVPRFS